MRLAGERRSSHLGCMTNPPPIPPQPLRKTGHAKALAARERKRTEASAMGIDDAYVDRLVETFYAAIRSDALLGPIFAARITDWPAHLARMKQFWRSILHNSGEFTGNPMQKHAALPGLEEAHFAHWLELFYAVVRKMDGADGAGEQVASRARMIADSLLTGIETRRHGMAGTRAGAGLPVFR
jgi:hemoglobin